MIAKVTTPELSQDVSGAEALISRHAEYRSEIDTRTDAFTKFSQAGRKLIQQVCSYLACHCVVFQ